MPTLPLPNLDDRRWAELVDEGRSLIPFYAPGWTDHNVHDPGVSLLELFAWVTEMDLYAVNRVTDAHRRKLLALAGGVAPDPPRPASTTLGLGLAPGAPPRPLPAGLEVEGSDPFGTAVRFRTLHELTVQPGWIAAVLAGRQAALEDLTAAWRRGEPFQPFGADPRRGDAFYLGFQLQAPWPAGTTLSLGFAPAEAGSGPAERERIARERAARAEDCPPPWASCGTAGTPTGDPGTHGLAHHAVRLLWEVMTGPGRWARLTSGAGLDDDTRALTLDGRVVAELPAPVPPGVLPGHSAPLAWLRVRLVRGAYDAPPVLRGVAFNAAEAVQAVPAVVRLRIAPGAPVAGDPPASGALASLDLQVDRQGVVTGLTFAPPAADRPAVRVLAFDPADPAGRSLTIEAAAVARGSGAPAQRIQVPHAPVVASSLRLASLEGGTWRDWTPRADFDASGRADAHLLLDPTPGTVTLGDGERGRTAAPGSTLLVTAELTRGGDGNLPAGAVDRLADSPHNQAAVPDLDELTTQLTSIANVVPAAGGRAAETLDAAVARAREGREWPRRAVTLSDYVTLALRTPGVRLARAEARANFHPGFPCLTAPGVVTVLVLPFLPAGRPAPSPGLRQAVAAYLNRRRTVGTRVEVAGPVYVTVSVRATVQACPNARRGEVEGAVRAALDRFFHPLTGGPDGTGWPFGRDVYRAEVLQVIDEVPGVAHVLALELVGNGGEPTCGNLCLGPTGLVRAGSLEVDVP
jgi:predicted phage baseplate assembly protein